MLTVLATGVEGLAIAKVVEGEVEPIVRTKGLVAAEEAVILVVETRIRTKAGAVGTMTAGVRHVQLSAIFQQLREFREGRLPSHQLSIQPCCLM